MPFTNPKIRSRRRRGAECVEVALTLPLMMIAMFSTITISHQWHVEKLLKLATYEAIKAGCATEGDADAAIAIFNEHTTALGINGAVLTIDEAAFNDAEMGDSLSLMGSAPASQNSVISPISIFQSDTISGGTVYYRKEGL